MGHGNHDEDFYWRLGSAGAGDGAPDIVGRELFSRKALFEVIDPAADDTTGWRAASEAMTSEWSYTVPLLTAGEEPLLGFWIEAGVLAREQLDRAGEGRLPGASDDALRAVVAAGDRAMERMMLANVRLVYYWAIRRCTARSTGGLDREDLVGEGILGLRRAIEKWDFRRGLKFSTYASTWIRQFIGRAVLRAQMLHLSDGDQEALAQLRRLRQESDVHGRALLVSVVRQELQVTTGRAKDLLNLLAATSMRSLDALLDSSASTTELVDMIADPQAGPEELLEHAERRSALSAALEKLSPRERAVVCAFVGWDGSAPATAVEVARRFGVTQDMVERVSRGALAKMRHEMMAGDDTDLAWSA